MTPHRPVHELAMELREAMDDLLPDGVGVVVNASEKQDGTGFVRLTISSWPHDMPMLNRERVLADRQAFLQGSFTNISHLPILSPEANHLAEILQALLDKHFPPVKEADATTWPVNTDVLFDERALERERIAIIHTEREKWRSHSSTNAATHR